jgi:hypothetical protein
LCEGAPRQKAAESRKIPESGSVIPREGVESPEEEGEREMNWKLKAVRDPERGS